MTRGQGCSLAGEYDILDLHIKSGFEKVSEWDTTIQDTMEEYDNVER